MENGDAILIARLSVRLLLSSVGTGGCCQNAVVSASKGSGVMNKHIFPFGGRPRRGPPALSRLLPRRLLSLRCCPPGGPLQFCTPSCRVAAAPSASCTVVAYPLGRGGHCQPCDQPGRPCLFCCASSSCRCHSFLGGLCNRRVQTGRLCCCHCFTGSFSLFCCPPPGLGVPFPSGFFSKPSSYRVPGGSASPASTVFPHRPVMPIQPAPLATRDVLHLYLHNNTTITITITITSANAIFIVVPCALLFFAHRKAAFGWLPGGRKQRYRLPVEQQQRRQAAVLVVAVCCLLLHASYLMLATCSMLRLLLAACCLLLAPCCLHLAACSLQHSWSKKQKAIAHKSQP